MVDKQATRFIFAQRFSDLRREMDMNQSTFAQYLGLSRAAVSFYENADKEGGRLPDMVTLKRLCAKLRVPADYLLGLSSERVYGKYLNPDVIIDTLVAIGFSREIAEKIIKADNIFIDPFHRGVIIPAMDLLLGTTSAEDFLAALYSCVAEYKMGLELYNTEQPLSPDDLDYYQKKLGASGMRIINLQDYLNVIFNNRFDKEIVPLLKTVIEELLSKARDNHERMKAWVLEKCAPDDSAIEE